MIPSPIWIPSGKFGQIFGFAKSQRIRRFREQLFLSQHQIAAAEFRNFPQVVPISLEKSLDIPHGISK